MSWIVLMKYKNIFAFFFHYFSTLRWCGQFKSFLMEAMTCLLWLVKTWIPDGLATQGWFEESNQVFAFYIIMQHYHFKGLFTAARVSSGISTVYCKIAVSPLLTYWKYCSLALNHQYSIDVIYPSTLDDIMICTVTGHRSIPLTKGQ